MKKMISCLAILTMLAYMVSCGSMENDEAYENAKSSSQTTTSAAATTEADVSEEKNTTAAKADDNTKNTTKTDTSAKDSEEDKLVLNEADRLFGGYVDTQGDDLNLRKEPFSTADIIETIPNGTQLDIYSCGKNGWYCTSFKGKSGYVSADYIKEIPAFEPQENTQVYVTDISELVGQWKYQLAAENKTVDISETDNGTINVKEDGTYTYTYTDLDGNIHSGTVKLDYDTFGENYKVPFFAFYEGDKFFIGCYCHESHSDVYMEGNGGMSQIVRIK